MTGLAIFAIVIVVILVAAIATARRHRHNGRDVGGGDAPIYTGSWDSGGDCGGDGGGGD